MSNDPIQRELTWSWHRSPGWAGQLDRVRRWHIRLLNTTAPYEVEDFLYAFFQNCYHIRDWLPEDEFQPDDIEQLFQLNVELRLCRDVCNLTKHFELNRPPAMGRELSLASEYCGGGQGWFGDDSRLVILSQGAKYDAREVASRCLQIWEEFLQVRK